MNPVVLSRGLAVAVLAAAALLGSCATNNAEAEAQAEAARLAAEAAANAPPPIALNDSVAQAASVYVAFTRDMALIQGGFADPEAVQAALRRGSAYNPEQLSRGLVAYASILALQSPEFVAGVRQYAAHAPTRQKLIADIVSDPRYASHLPGADAAAALITSAMREDINALYTAANSVENDAYTIQANYDPRRGWGVAEVGDRQGRLDAAKARSAEVMQGSAEDAARLSAQAHAGGTRTTTERRPKPPFAPVVENALALAALAALGAAGDNAQANVDALQDEPTSKHCLDMSKLMLFQCLAASRPSYEDIFCVGRHVVRDLATCTRGASMPAVVITVSDVIPSPAVRPAPFITPAAPLFEPERPAPAPAQAPIPARSTPEPRTAPPPARPAPSLTERLNTEPPSD